MIQLVTDRRSPVRDLFNFVSSVVCTSNGTWRSDSKRHPVQIWTPGHVEGSVGVPQDITHLWPERHFAMKQKGYTEADITRMVQTPDYCDVDGSCPAEGTLFEGEYYQFKSDWLAIDMEQWVGIFLVPVIVDALLATKFLINKERRRNNRNMVKLCDLVVGGDQRPLIAKVARWNLERDLRGATPDKWRGTTTGEDRLKDDCKSALDILGSTQITVLTEQIDGQLIYANWLVE
jgi:hypothetical protein